MLYIIVNLFDRHIDMQIQLKTKNDEARLLIQLRRPLVKKRKKNLHMLTKQEATVQHGCLQLTSSRHVHMGIEVGF